MSTVRQVLRTKEHREIYSVGPDQSTYEALQVMADKDVGAVTVVEGGVLKGILTEREYARRIVLHGKTSRHTPVKDTMNRNFPTVTPDTSVDECMRLMTDRRFRYVAVMDEDRCIGLVSIGDVVKDVICRQQANIDNLERYITGV